MIPCAPTEETFDAGARVVPPPSGDVGYRYTFAVTADGDLQRAQTPAACPPKLQIAR